MLALWVVRVGSTIGSTAKSPARILNEYSGGTGDELDKDAGSERRNGVPVEGRPMAGWIRGESIQLKTYPIGTPTGSRSVPVTAMMAIR